MKLGVIGFGKMGSAIVRGVISAGIAERRNIYIYDVNSTVIHSADEEGYSICGNLNAVFQSCDTVLFSVKPQEAAALIALVSEIGSCKLILSIMAGVPFSAFARLGEIAMARIMPNTCAVIGESASAICYNQYVTPDSAALVRKICGAIGEYVEIDESLMDDVIPAGGSFTAYAYLFMKAFIDSSVKRGIEKDIAKRLVIQSMIGSAKMVEQFDDMEKLIKDVCSKGGTTLAGLEKLYGGGFETLIDDCCIACAERSKELSKLF